MNKKIVNLERGINLNFLELTHGSTQSNIGAIIESLVFHTYTSRTSYDNPNYKSYDAYIINFSYLIDLHENELITTIEKLIESKKPCFIIYTNEFYFKKDPLSANNSAYDTCIKAIKFLNEYINFEFSSIDAGVIDYNNFHLMTNYYFSDNKKLLIKTCENNKFISVKNSEYYHMVNKNNITIMLDPEYSDSPDGINRCFINYILGLFNEKNNNKSHPQWVDNVIILDDVYLDKQVQKYNKDIDDIMCKIDDLKLKKEKNDLIKRLFYSEGDELVDVVVFLINEILGIDNNNFTDIKKEDYRISLNEFDILFEIKGVNNPVRKNHISQLWNHLNDAEDLDNTKKYKGCLIVNPYRKCDLKDRLKKDFYSPEVKKYIEYLKICSIDTITLYSYYNLFVNGDLSSNDFKKILLDKTYNEPILDTLKFKNE